MYRVGSPLSDIPRPVMAIFVSFNRTAASRQSLPIMDFLREAFELSISRFALRSPATKFAISLVDNSVGQYDEVAFLPPLQAGHYALVPLYVEDKWFTLRFEATRFVEEGHSFKKDKKSCNADVGYSYAKVVFPFIAKPS
jgi:hypothetical protein